MSCCAHATRKPRPCWPRLLTLRVARATIRPSSSNGSFRGLCIILRPGRLTLADIETLRVLLDASSRRFRAHRIYLRASAAVRWATRRQQVLKGQKPQPSHSQVLKQNDDTLKQVSPPLSVPQTWLDLVLRGLLVLKTINTITDKKVYDELRAKDTAAGNWIAEMADLKTLLAYVRSH